MNKPEYNHNLQKWEVKHGNAASWLDSFETAYD